MRKLGHVITTSLFIGSSRKTFVSCLDEGLFFKIRGYAGKTSSCPSKVVRVSCGKSTQNYNSTTNGKYRYRIKSVLNPLWPIGKPVDFSGEVLRLIQVKGSAELKMAYNVVLLDNG